MNNFTYWNPVDIHFGRGSIRDLSELIAPEERILLLYGGGSIKKNGVYQQVIKALSGRDLVEFSGIEANPEYETCCQAVEKIRETDRNFILAVGGGSVLDAAKFISAAVVSDAEEPWDIILGKTPINDAMALGSVMTLPATGSEVNNNAVISRRALAQKRPISSPHLFPRFSILDPETTMSLPPRQLANGIVDSFVHVMEQYLTYPLNSPLQDRSAEAVLLTLIEEGPKAMQHPNDYDTRANLFWAASIALNKQLGVGVAQDWSSHAIGHEITALYGIDHARTLAVVLPGVMAYKRDSKKEKLLQYASRIWGIDQGDEQVRIDEAIARTVLFFESLSVPCRLREYDLPEEAPQEIASRFPEGLCVGEHQDICASDIKKILMLRS